jgi:hypothetical protein
LPAVDPLPIIGPPQLSRDDDFLPILTVPELHFSQNLLSVRGIITPRRGSALLAVRDHPEVLPAGVLPAVRGLPLFRHGQRQRPFRGTTEFLTGRLSRLALGFGEFVRRAHGSGRRGAAVEVLFKGRSANPQASRREPDDRQVPTRDLEFDEPPANFKKFGCFAESDDRPDSDVPRGVLFGQCGLHDRPAPDRMIAVNFFD